MIEDDEVRALFFDTDDFAEEVTVTPNAGDAFTILAIFDARPKEANPNYRDGAALSGAHPQMTCRSVDFPVDLMGQCTVVVRGLNYNAYDVKPDSTGITCVELRRQ